MYESSVALFRENAPAKIHRPQVAHQFSRLEAPPAEALEAERKIRALEAARRAKSA